MLVVSWLLEREYRQHRALDPALPLTYTKWLATTDRLQQEIDEKRERVVKVVIHPGEIATWAYREGREVNERARSDYAVFMWRLETNRRLEGRDNPAMASRRDAGPHASKQTLAGRPDRKPHSIHGPGKVMRANVSKGNAWNGSPSRIRRTARDLAAGLEKHRPQSVS